MSGSPLLVDARFLLAPRTGVQRVARDLLVAARRHSLAFTTVAPARPRPDDPALPVDRAIPAPPGRIGALVWEQTVLPAAARGQTLLCPANLSPLVGADATVLVHDLAPIIGPQWFSASGRLYGRLALAGARRARRVLTVSDATRAELVAHGVAAERVHVVRPAVEQTLCAASDEAVAGVRRTHGLDRDYVLFVGWADPRKDVGTAAAASARVAERRPHDLVLLGRGHPSFAPVRAPQTPNVRVLGYVDDDSLVALMTGATALVYPTRYEGFGLPPLEAWACGTPALVSDLPVLREATQGQAAYVPVGDVEAWAQAIESALAGAVPVPARPQWTWDDAARRLITALATAAPPR